MPTIPILYRILFLWMDPFMTAFAGYIALVTPTVLLRASARDDTPDMRYRSLCQQLGGAQLSLAFLGAVLPRVAPVDLRVWKALQAAFLLHDGAMLWDIGQGLARDGETDLGQLPPKQRVFLGGMVVVAALRVCFMAEVGFGGSGLH